MINNKHKIQLCKGLTFYMLNNYEHTRAKHNRRSFLFVFYRLY